MRCLWRESRRGRFVVPPQKPGLRFQEQTPEAVCDRAWSRPWRVWQRKQVSARKPGETTWPKTRRVNVVFANSGARFEHVLVCATPFARSRGLLFRKATEQALLWPCASVHSIGMGHAIDLIYLSAAGVVVRIVRRLVPMRMSSGGKNAFAVLEVQAGSCGDVQMGERVSFEEVAK